MLAAGIDVGSRNIRVVVLRDGEVVGRAALPAGFDQEEAARRGLEGAAAEAHAGAQDLEFVVKTGAGRRAISLGGEQMTEVAADARGAFALSPGALTVVEVGAESARAIRVDERGKVVDFAINEKCAAGAGAFVEAMGRALELGLERFGELSLLSTETIALNAQCTVFAESEVVSLIHANTAPKDIARAVHDAVARRVSALARRAGIEKRVVIGGGLARNPGFVEALRVALGGVSLEVVPQPEYLGAYGAALAAAQFAATEPAVSGGMIP